MKSIKIQTSYLLTSIMLISALPIYSAEEENFPTAKRQCIKVPFNTENPLYYRLTFDEAYAKAEVKNKTAYTHALLQAHREILEIQNSIKQKNAPLGNCFNAGIDIFYVKCLRRIHNDEIKKIMSPVFPEDVYFSSMRNIMFDIIGLYSYNFTVKNKGYAQKSFEPEIISNTMLKNFEEILKRKIVKKYELETEQKNAAEALMKLTKAHR